MDESTTSVRTKASNTIESMIIDGKHKFFLWVSRNDGEWGDFFLNT